MKKILSVLLVTVMAAVLTACGGRGGQKENMATETPSEAGDSMSSEKEQETAETPGTSSGSTEGETDEENSPDAPESDGARVLVVYFSATGTTKGIAEMAAEGMGADIYEIVPQEPYTDADLDWHDDNSRSTIEMNDKSSRPQINGTVENMEQYDIVFIGYPIWWGEAPRIVSTFMESYSFEGKTLIPFCTSSSSGLGSSGKNLESLTNGAEWLEGRRFGSGASSDEVISWIEGLALDINVGAR